MKDPVILVGLRLGEHYRDRNWSFAKEWWTQHTGWPIYEGHHDEPGEFCLSVASNRAAAAAGDWDVAFYIGADFILGDSLQARRAVAEARRTGQMTFAHSLMIQLAEGETEHLMESGQIRAHGQRERNTFSGAFAIPRELWDAVGGFDERFVGWGWDDIAFWASCWAMGGGFQRVPGLIYHLWHPRPENPHGPHYAANDALGRRYLDVKTSREAMMEILAER